MDAIVLAGGLGTRLRPVIADVPKPMAPVNGTPFLDILLSRLLNYSKIERIVLAVGYKKEIVQAYFGSEKDGRPVVYAVETASLGTGGGILNAVSQSCFCGSSETVLVLNGDTLFEVDIEGMSRHHQQQQADITLALKPMTDFERYGTVETVDARVTGFKEKQYCASGNINGGVYLINRGLFDKVAVETLPEKFSFETDILEHYCDQLNICGFVSDGYFIDIGIPTDYQRAQRELCNLPCS